jgi:hypothetical protein
MTKMRNFDFEDGSTVLAHQVLNYGFKLRLHAAINCVRFVFWYMSWSKHM